MGFFQDIQHHYGANAVGLLKCWVKTNNKLASLRNRRNFLLQCRHHSIYPRHITDHSTPFISLTDVHNGRTLQHIKDLNLRLEHKILNIEIKVTHQNITRLEKCLDNTIKRLTTILPNHIVFDFQHKQTVSYNFTFHRIKQNNVRKFNNLLTAQRRPVRTKDNWLKNLTNVQIPTDIKNFLALGPKFSLQPSIKDFSIVKLLADFESIVNISTIDNKVLYTAQVTNILTNYIHNNKHSNNIWFPTIKKTIRFLKDNPDLAVLKADKGNITVVWSKNEYNNFSLEHLMDDKYYVKLNKNPTITIQTKANKIISQLKNNNYISAETSKKHTLYNTVPSKFYCLPKVHKQDLCVRPIVSSIDSPNSGITQLFTDILTVSYNKTNSYYIKDSFEFATFINGFKLPENYVLISLDVVSLYTNIHINLIIDSIKKHWAAISNFTKIPQKIFLEAIEFIFDTNFFSFNNIFYKQILGTPMGSSISPIVSQFVMDDLLNDCLSTLPFQVPFLKKYVDDIICAIPAGSEDLILNTFNNHNQYLSFTLERETNNSVPFLDTKLIRGNDGLIILNWYQKPTNTGRYLNYLSFHEERIKINLVLGLKNRIEKVCHPTLRIDNLKKLYNILIDNSYPKPLLNKLLFSNPSFTHTENNINTRVTQPTNSNDLEPQRALRTTYRSLPHVNNLTNRIINVFKSELTTVKIAKRSVFTINNFFSKLKDKTPLLSMNNIVYRIPCSDCGELYIGQTKRTLQQRITSHKSDINRKITNCALSEHSINNKHKPKYDAVSILHNERILNKRLFLEMVEINDEPKSMNKKTDINNLSTIYTYLLKLNKDLLKNNNNDISSDSLSHLQID